MSAAKARGKGGPREPAFVVGVDLGTTNSAVAYVDLRAEKGPVTVFPVPQLVRPGVVEARPQLPSNLYLAGQELADKARALPFEPPEPATVLGLLASEQGAKVPDRLVSSHKSWLCHAGVDRREAILPWGVPSEDEVPKVSPLEAARRVLVHIRNAWDHAMAQGDDALALGEQEVLLCVPASFDPQARELTLEAARLAGLERVTLLEEPQAAFYAWLERSGDAWREQVGKEDVVLVVDVGGGTTDLTLIAVRDDGQGNLTLERVAVGEHLLLGGDNMDLALAHVAARKLEAAGAKGLDPWQSRALWHAARGAKEALLGDPERAQADVVVLGRGSKLIGGSLKTTLTREEVEGVAVQGFFPACGKDDRPTRRRAAGLSELGLPFEADAAITRHIAAFVGRQAQPTALLFNGGVFKAPPLRRATVDALAGWLGAPPKVLEGEDLDLAVSRGAAYYGLVRRGRGVRIRGGTARTYYIGIESTLPAVPGLPAPIKALCVAPFGMEEGTSVDLPGKELALLVGEPADFRFLASTTRKDDPAGRLVDRWDEGELVELAPLQVALPPAEGQAAGATVPVTLRSTVTEVGTLEVHCVTKGGQRYRLEWNVREGG
ncbi:MAG: Hsp70 family protein [Planctomycetes bacterium]|nr:Hsp70 family protein [Planctomycetota bacterium]